MAKQKPNEKGKRHIEAAIKSMMKMKASGETNADLFVRVFKREPLNRSELTTFANRFNLARANPPATFIAMFVEAHPELKEMTLGEFFDLD